MSEEGPIHQVRLRDGRDLAWAEWGAPTGRPVVYLHGFPGSRLEPALCQETAAARGLRLVAPDRPGFGRSDPKPGRTLLDFADDVAELADALGLERFGVMGFSGGGPYAAACAFRLPGRLSGVALVGGLGPVDGPGASRGMVPMNRFLFEVARRLPWLVGPVMALTVRLVRRDPERAFERARKSLPEPDVRALARPEVHTRTVRATVEALRAGARPATQEAKLYARPWGFALEDVGVPLHLFHGERDRSVPPHHARRQAAAYPHCTPHFTRTRRTSRCW